jgi:hypothetical protein
MCKIRICVQFIICGQVSTHTNGLVWHSMCGPVGGRRPELDVYNFPLTFTMQTVGIFTSAHCLGGEGGGRLSLSGILFTPLPLFSFIFSF